MPKAIDESTLSARLRKAGLRLEQRGDFFLIRSGPQVLLDRGHSGEPLTLQEVATFVERQVPQL